MAAAEKGTGAPIPPQLYLGTSSWSSKDWEGVFYPKGAPPSSWLSHYATRFRTVEVDATFYRIPPASMTRKWRTDLPDGFRLAAKAPQSITHEKGLEGVSEDLTAFLRSMDSLGDRLGPILFQFPYFKKGGEMTEDLFLERLRKFVPSLPEGYRFALELRNKSWLREPLLETLRGRSVALALIDHPWMPRAAEYLARIDPVTSEFFYLRWLGDRYAIEKQTKSWDKVIVDRTREMRAWVPVVRQLLGRNLTGYGFFNNHFAGHAPASIELFEKICSETPES